MAQAQFHAMHIGPGPITVKQTALTTFILDLTNHVRNLTIITRKYVNKVGPFLHLF